MLNEKNFIPFEISKDEEKLVNSDALNSRYNCIKCNKKTYAKKKYELDYLKFLIFSFLLMGSFSLLIIILMISFIRRRFFQKIIKDDISVKARERNNVLGLVLPQRIDTICLDCSYIIKTEKDSGDFTIVIIMFSIIVVSVLFFLFKSNII